MIWLKSIIHRTQPGLTESSERAYNECRENQGGMMVSARIAAPYAALFALAGCASAQLNYNTVDLASTIDSLLTEQVLSNLAKFIDSPHAIPSQVGIAAGTVTTNNVIQPNVTSPLNIASVATNTIATTFAATTSSVATRTNTRTLNNAGVGLTMTDQWQQNWTIAPVTDSDQLRRLRSLYRFATTNLNRQELLCNYPIVQKKDGTSQAPSAGQASATTSGRNITISFQASTPTKREYRIYCSSGTLRFENADPSFLSPPSCVICYDPDPRYRQDNKGCETQATKDAATNLEVLCLHTNWRLRPDWLRYTDNPLSVPRDAIVLGQRRNKIMYVINRDDLEAFYEFSLFINEATAATATSGTAILLSAQSKAF